MARVGSQRHSKKKECFSQKPKHVAGNNTDINVVVIDGLYFLSANTYDDDNDVDGDDDDDDDDDGGDDTIPDSK
jgi:hypothetical protein